MLSIRGLSKTYGGGRLPTVVALDRVDLDVDEGQFATVLGPSGCGKTTLLRAIAGFESPASGTITIGGREIARPGRRPVPAHARGVSVVPQDGALFPHLSVAQNVGFGLDSLGRRRRSRRIDETLELVGLSGLASRRPHELSGGQQQRVAVARAIAPNPRVVLLDEPFSALDSHLRQSLRAEVRDLLKAISSTVVLVTHDQSEALTMADHLVVMREGRVVQAGSPRATYLRPRDIELARFLGDAVVVSGEIPPANGAPVTVSCPFGTLPIASWHGESGSCDVLIRPEDIHAQPLRDARNQTGGDARNQTGGDARAPSGLVGTIVGQSFYGHDGLLQVQLPQLADQVPVRVMGEQAYHLGDSVRLSVEHGVCTYYA